MKAKTARRFLARKKWKLADEPGAALLRQAQKARPVLRKKQRKNDKTIVSTNN